MKKSESHSEDTLKHKPDASSAEDAEQTGEPASDKEEWSQRLQKFCFCEEGAASKNGRAKWRSMCRYHQLRMRKGCPAVHSKNSLNLARAVRAHRPLLQEGRLKQTDSKNKTLPLFMRCARFEFTYKPVKLGETIDKSGVRTPPLETATSVAATDGISAKAGGSKGLASPASKKSTSASPPVFAAAASQKLSTFSSLHTDSKDAAHSSKHPMPTFEGYRSAPDCQRRLPLWPSVNQSQSHTSSPPHTEGGGAAATVPPRVELAVERSCSQEARLDESEVSVNELAAYFDNFLYMPKEMSSMAQMMYT